MDVSKNSGTSKSSILIRFSIINHPFWGTSIFGNTHILVPGCFKRNLVGANHPPPPCCQSSSNLVGKIDMSPFLMDISTTQKIWGHFTQMVESNATNLSFPRTVGLCVKQFNQLSIHPGFDHHSPAWVCKCLVEPWCFPMHPHRTVRVEEKTSNSDL